MPLAPGDVGRDNEASGQPFLVLIDGVGRRVQAVGFVDGEGAHAGVALNPLSVGVVGPVEMVVGSNLPVAVQGDVGIDDSTALRVNVVEGLTDPLPTVAASPAQIRFKSTGYVNALVNVGSGACDLMELRVFGNPFNAADHYLLWFNQTSAPSPGAPPDWVTVIPGNGGFMAESYIVGGSRWSTGCTLMASTSPLSLSVPSTAAAQIYGSRI